ncbi:MAG: LytTR family transcriptional regulator [Bacteroidales bacterium]|nr:LytTR family transcriptional regulator [Bacteroidales bacterium]
MPDFLIITNTSEFLRIPAESLVFVSSDGNYSDIGTRDGHKHTVTVQLGVIEEMIKDQMPDRSREFVRIGKSLIVNLSFVHYINPSKKQIVLSDCHTFKFSLEASKEALKLLKEYVEPKTTKK